MDIQKHSTWTGYNYQPLLSLGGLSYLDSPASGKAARLKSPRLNFALFLLCGAKSLNHAVGIHGFSYLFIHPALHAGLILVIPLA